MIPSQKSIHVIDVGDSRLYFSHDTSGVVLVDSLTAALEGPNLAGPIPEKEQPLKACEPYPRNRAQRRAKKYGRKWL